MHVSCEIMMLENPDLCMKQRQYPQPSAMDLETITE
jgi:hypothetical protein